MITARNLGDIPIMDTAHNVDARNLYTTEHVVVTVITLKPGQQLRKHITPVDVAFYVLKGSGTVQIGDEKLTVQEYTLVESPKNILHCWYNEGEDDLVLMVIKAPRPEKKTVFLS